MRGKVAYVAVLLFGCIWGCGPGDSRKFNAVTIYYVPFAAQPIIPIDANNIESAPYVVRNIAPDVIDDLVHEMKSKRAGIFRSKSVRAKIVFDGEEYFVDAFGGVRAGWRYYAVDPQRLESVISSCFVQIVLMTPSPSAAWAEPLGSANGHAIALAKKNQLRLKEVLNERSVGPFDPKRRVLRITFGGSVYEIDSRGGMIVNGDGFSSARIDINKLTSVLVEIAPHHQQVR